MQIWLPPMGFLHIAGDAVDHIDIDAEGADAHQRLAGNLSRIRRYFGVGGIGPHASTAHEVFPP
jgi:hypothetical protein